MNPQMPQLDQFFHIFLEKDMLKEKNKVKVK